jgi:hypothetical protein
MPALVADEMLDAFAVEAGPDELGPAFRERYDGLVHRLSPYLPFVPGEKDELWQTLAQAFD